ncbi:radical SAM protein [Treponema parvum]|uniref:Radical SAM protein n=1 Tax=Treponema parvum TaxID=138851 RepID=A0A975IF34_9SPIR|nr:radical SAM protein [Treponema parvum]QTQ14457.1 radical SAM protein [Treponema parvum]
MTNSPTENKMPLLVSSHYKLILKRLSDAEEEEYLKAMRRQIFPSDKEDSVLPYEISDPLGACKFQVTKRAVHQYKNRILLLTTGKCFSNCRYCFRRDSSIRGEGFIPTEEIENVCAYVKNHPEVQEILLSGGDCLTASDNELFDLIGSLRSTRASPTNTCCPDELLIRICTRAPVFAPERFTSSLISMLQSLRPLWLIPHINHPAEIDPKYSPETVLVLKRLIDSGIPVQSQTVLLRGVNDSVEILSKLFHGLTLLGVRPGYLFQGDLVPGTAHFRVPIEKGISLYEKLRKELSGLSTPVYAVDLPGGGGKINLLRFASDLTHFQIIKGKKDYKIKDEDGNVWSYPIE